MLELALDLNVPRLALDLITHRCLTPYALMEVMAGQRAEQMAAQIASADADAARVKEALEIVKQHKSVIDFLEAPSPRVPARALDLGFPEGSP